MTRVFVIGAGAGAADVAAQLDALGLSAIRTAVEFRDLVLSMPDIDVTASLLPPAPRFGGDRPYLKKKKGRS